MKLIRRWLVAVIAATALVSLPHEALAIVGPTLSCSAGSCTATFTDTSSVYSWNVPAGVTTISVVIKGGKGGNGNPLSSNPGGSGGRVSGTVNVSGVSSLNIYVGAAGENVNSQIARNSIGGVSGGTPSGGLSPYISNAYIGGGGGGLSRIVNASNSETILLAAGGGGGGSYAGNSGGSGGSATWSSNVANGISVSRVGSDGSFGGGGGSTTGGLGGAPNQSGGWGETGTALVGGRGGSASTNASGGGGGGGWFGGGGGGGDTNPAGQDAAGGGGGSNYYNPAYFSTTPSTFAADTTSDGSVTITYAALASFGVISGTNYTYRSTSSITYSSGSIIGKATFYFQRTVIAGCRNLPVTSANNYSVTCNWKPALIGPVTLKVIMVPTDNQIPAPAPSIVNVFVNKRSGTR